MQTCKMYRCSSIYDTLVANGITQTLSSLKDWLIAYTIEINTTKVTLARD